MRRCDLKEFALRFLVDMDALADVHSRDFLHQHAQTPLRENYVAAGATCSFITNSKQLLEAARGSFVSRSASSGLDTDFTVRLWVDRSHSSNAPWPKPFVRGVDHLVFAGFDAKSSLLADLQKRQVIGRFSEQMARDTKYWQRVIFPMLLSIMSGSVGLVELHASCVAQGSQGLALVGATRSGKSTLAMALTNMGYRLLSDDRTFCSLGDGGITAYGLPRPLKLRSDAGSFFEEFRHRKPTDVQNGENVFLCDTDRRDSGKVAPCELKAILVLERSDTDPFALSAMNALEFRSRIAQEMLSESPEALSKQNKVLDALSQIPCWSLRYSGPPQAIAEQIHSLFPDKFRAHDFIS
jgi:hypothetical protein